MIGDHSLPERFDVRVRRLMFDVLPKHDLLVIEVPGSIDELLFVIGKEISSADSGAGG